MDSKAIRTLLVDDQVLYREAMRGLIERWPEYEVVGEASDGQEAVDLALYHEPDLILMDVRMPKMDGIAASRAILARQPDMPIVLLTVESDKALVFGALQSGVRGYLLKDTPARKLKDRLFAVMQGGATLSEAIAGSVVDEFARMRMAKGGGTSSSDAPQMTGFDQLTSREREILSLVAKGQSNEQIGEELFLSLGTVKKHISQIMMRLGLENRVQLAVYAVKAGLDK